MYLESSPFHGFLADKTKLMVCFDSNKVKDDLAFYEK